MMSFVRVLSNSSSKAAGYACVRPHSAEGRRGFRFFLVFFFRAAIASESGSGHRDLANFLRAVAEACSPQRFREENAVVRFISLSEPGDTGMYTTIYVYEVLSLAAALVEAVLKKLARGK
jgi:hypothetical protein